MVRWRERGPGRRYRFFRVDARCCLRVISRIFSLTSKVRELKLEGLQQCR